MAERYEARDQGEDADGNGRITDEERGEDQLGLDATTTSARRSSRAAPTTSPRAPIRGTGAWPTLKRAALEFQEDNMTDWAAALTYYGLLSLFPALIALVSILGLVRRPGGDDRVAHRHRHRDRPRHRRRHLQRPDRVDHLQPVRRRRPASSSASASRSGPPRATSAPSCAPRT